MSALFEIDTQQINGMHLWDKKNLPNFTDSSPIEWLNKQILKIEKFQKHGTLKTILPSKSQQDAVWQNNILNNYMLYQLSKLCYSSEQFIS